MFGGFGAAASFQAYQQAKRDARSLPHRDVSTAEFIRLMVAQGVPEDRAKQHAGISRGMGSHVRIGREMVRVLDEQRTTKVK